MIKAHQLRHFEVGANGCEQNRVVAFLLDLEGLLKPLLKIDCGHLDALQVHSSLRKSSLAERLLGGSWRFAILVLGFDGVCILKFIAEGVLVELIQLILAKSCAVPDEIHACHIILNSLRLTLNLRQFKSTGYLLIGFLELLAHK